MHDDLENKTKQLKKVAFHYGSHRGLALWRCLRLAFCFLGILIIYSPKFLLFGKGLSGRTANRLHRRIYKIMGVKVRTIGKPIEDLSHITVSNHASYLDIMVLGSRARGRFVAKKEVRSWPVFGLMAALQKSFFIERNRPKARKQMAELEQVLKEGGNLIIFPEGTTSNGNIVLPFKSTLFDIAKTSVPTGSVKVQPVTIAYSRLDGNPLPRFLRPVCTWFGDMTLGKHAFYLLGLNCVGVDLIFHPATTLEACGGRKQLAQQTHDVISKGLQEALQGRLEAPVKPYRRYRI